MEKDNQHVCLTTDLTNAIAPDSNLALKSKLKSKIPYKLKALQT